MNLQQDKYKKYALVKEMMETSAAIRAFKPDCLSDFVAVAAGRNLFLSGEGSSRIFPAKRAVYNSMKHPNGFSIRTDGSLQAMEYKLDEYVVIGASNSGRTKELITLMRHLKDMGHNYLLGITATPASMLQETCRLTHVLGCGKEEAVAASKSVIEQALCYDALVRLLMGENPDSLDLLADMFESVLLSEPSREITDALASADTIYFAGRNNGVAEELALKTNEIVRKKSGFLEGTYAVHGIEEVMTERDVIIWMDPFTSEIEKYRDTLLKGVGVKIIAVSSTTSCFPTFSIPDGGIYSEYLQLAAGWNMLVEAGLTCGADLDRPARARKIGNAI